MTTLPADELVERLVNPMSAHGLRLAAKEAAAELPALRAEVASLRKELAERTAERDEAVAAISRLTADNEALRKENAEARAAHHRTSHKAVKRLRALWREKQAAETRADTLARRVEGLKAALEAIRDFPKPGTSRRTEDGYPDEIVYDEFAYRRVVDSYREAARAALGDRP